MKEQCFLVRVNRRERGVTVLRRDKTEVRSQPWVSECPDVKNYKWRLNQVWHR